MRLKKLRVILAVCLVIFVVIVANIVMFGAFHDNAVVPVENKVQKLEPSNVDTQNLIVQSDENQLQDNQAGTTTIVSGSGVDSPTTTVSEPAPVVVVTHSRRTRAS